MDPLTDAANAALMRAAPAELPQREDFILTTAPGLDTKCQLYYTLQLSLPATTPVHPDSSLEIRGVDALTLSRPDPDLIFTHGKGSSLNNPAVVAFCQGFARTHSVLCFEDTREMTPRVSTFRSLMNQFPSATAIGGRSMGARASCRAALYSPVKKLIFFTYPLTRGLSERYEELLALEADIDVLLIVGDSDPMCVELLLKPVRERMRARTWWIRLVGADHAIWYDDEEVRDNICNVAGQIAASWQVDGNRDPTTTELTLKFDEALNQVMWTGWLAASKEEPKQQMHINIGIVGRGF